MRKTPIVICLIICVVVVGVAYFILTKPHGVRYYGLGKPKYYSLGEPIEDYPFEGLMTVYTSVRVAKEFSAFYSEEEGKVYVIISLTMRNIGDSKLDLPPFYFYISAYFPALKYDGYYVSFPDHVEVEKGELFPNETTEGIIFYKIPEEYQPIELLYPDQENPEWIVKLD